MNPPGGTIYPLADRLLDGKLAAYLRSSRENGRSVREIAGDLRNDYDIDVSHETVRIWCNTLGLD